MESLPANAGDVGLIPGLGRSPGGGGGNLPQCSCLEDPTDTGIWQVAVHGVAESHTQMNVHRHTHTHTHTKYGPTIPRGLWLILVAHQANKIEAQAIWAEFP